MPSFLDPVYLVYSSWVALGSFLRNVLMARGLLSWSFRPTFSRSEVASFQAWISSKNRAESVVASLEGWKL